MSLVEASHRKRRCHSPRVIECIQSQIEMLPLRRCCSCNTQTLVRWRGCAAGSNEISSDLISLRTDFSSTERSEIQNVLFICTHGYKKTFLGCPRFLSRPPTSVHLSSLLFVYPDQQPSAPTLDTLRVGKDVRSIKIMQAENLSIRSFETN